MIKIDCWTYQSPSKSPKSFLQSILLLWWDIWCSNCTSSSKVLSTSALLLYYTRSEREDRHGTNISRISSSWLRHKWKLKFLVDITFTFTYVMSFFRWFDRWMDQMMKMISFRFNDCLWVEVVCWIGLRVNASHQMDSFWGDLVSFLYVCNLCNKCS